MHVVITIHAIEYESLKFRSFILHWRSTETKARRHTSRDLHALRTRVILANVFVDYWTCKFQDTPGISTYSHGVVKFSFLHYANLYHWEFSGSLTTNTSSLLSCQVNLANGKIYEFKINECPCSDFLIIRNLLTRLLKTLSKKKHHQPRTRVKSSRPSPTQFK
jgi:hypothetical protein